MFEEETNGAGPELDEVAASAARWGRRFGAKALAELAGLIHDLGKYGPGFQARLRDPTRSADHSTAGAVWAGYNRRAKVEAAMGRWKQVIGDGLRSRMDECRASEVNVAVGVLNRMLELGRPSYARIV